MMSNHIENKEKLIELYKSGSLGTYTFCRRHSIPLSTMFKWLKQAGVQPKGKISRKQNKNTSEKTSFKKLEVCGRENAAAKMESLSKTNDNNKT